MEFKEILNRSKGERFEYPEIFTDDTGIFNNLIFKDSNWQTNIINDIPVHTVKTWEDSREAILKINYYNQYYYGEIWIDGVDIINNETGELVITNHFEDPVIDNVYILKLSRPITYEEINNNVEYWKNYKSGDLTEKFNSEDDIIEFARKVFKNRFSGNWKFSYINIKGEKKLIYL